MQRMEVGQRMWEYQYEILIFLDA